MSVKLRDLRGDIRQHEKEVEQRFKAKLRRHIKKLRKENQVALDADYDYERMPTAQGYEAALDNLIDWLEGK